MGSLLFCVIILCENLWILYHMWAHSNFRRGECVFYLAKCKSDPFDALAIRVPLSVLTTMFGF